MSQPISPELAEAVGRTADRLFAVAEAAVAAWAVESPHYGARLDTRNIYPVVSHNVRVAGRYMVTDLGGDEPAEGDLAVRFDSVVRGAQLRAQEGMPIADMVDAHLMVFSIIASAVLDEIGPRPPAEVVAVLQALVQRQRRLTRLAIQAHQDEAASIGADTRAAEQELVEGLVGGNPDAELASRLGIRLAPAYHVLWFELGETPNEQRSDEVGRRASGRRKVRRVHDELRRRFGTDLLVRLEPTGGVALLPATDRTPEPARVRELLVRLSSVALASIHAGMVADAPAPELPEAVSLARELGELVRGRPQPALGVLSELPLEFQLSRDTRARGALAELTARLAPDLLTTLRSYFAHDFNRKKVARELGVHPNTIDNRLARIAELTGADPRTSRGLLLLGSALTVDDLHPDRATEATDR
ncbi:PucR family transcriptional regulator [Nocardioides albidus]|uniref:PucR family transcriptional regulator n=1 Tax=Nocardioides albidus TaxID=1517589 RepID=A0A5C4VZ00_9ACTN|nr:helix-turn-helix domain-containing protein [Nocardioides albidus]TNM41177.1 PucR family transcriptional regulator [Nocardioides albidus]